MNENVLKHLADPDVLPALPPLAEAWVAHAAKLLSRLGRLDRKDPTVIDRLQSALMRTWAEAVLPVMGQAVFSDPEAAPDRCFVLLLSRENHRMTFLRSFAGYVVDRSDNEDQWLISTYSLEVPWNPAHPTV